MERGIGSYKSPMVANWRMLLKYVNAVWDTCQVFGLNLSYFLRNFEDWYIRVACVVVFVP